jgi:rod shape determining protein RodA
VRRHRDIDWVLLLAAAALAAIGVSALASATGPIAALANRQITWIALGALALVIFLAVDYRAWGDLSPVLFGGGCAVLVGVLVAGHRVNGSKSWITVGPLNLQPSEFMKICTVLAVAKILAETRRESLGLGTIAAVAGVIGIPMALVLLQPDMGTELTFAALLGTVLLVGGLSKKMWALLVVAGIAGAVVGWSSVLKEYQRARIRSAFLVKDADPLGNDYQIIQSKIAIGSAGIGGKGWAAATQSQLNFIPEKHTDFVFPVVAEEWGFLGSLAVVGLYMVVFARGLSAALAARDALGAYLVVGIMAITASHVLVNLGMVTGLLPTIGIPLPLMSYGGSSVVSTLAGVGLILNVRMRRTANG